MFHPTRQKNGRPPACFSRGYAGNRARNALQQAADLEAFRRDLRGKPRKWLSDHVDELFGPVDEAHAQRHHEAFLLASVRWNAVWAEIDRRDAIADEAAS